MKKTLYILSALLLGLVSCTKTEMEAPEAKKAEKSGLVAITMKVHIPVELQAYTRADVGDRAEEPSIKSMRVAVFGTSGYPQAYAYAEPIVSKTDESAGKYADVNGDVFYFKVLLPVYDGEAHVHIIANGDESIKFVDEDEDSIMKKMKTQGNVGAYWARINMPDGILTQLDQNGIMQTDDEGNYIPSDGTAHLFEDLVLVRNFAEVRVINDATNIRNISWTLVNVPTMGSVAPMADNKFVDDYKNYEYDAETGKMVSGTKTYDGFMFEDDPMDFTIPAAGRDLANTIDDPGFVYERVKPADKATCILMRAQFYNGQAWDSEFTYYRLDLTDEHVGGYFPIYRNYKYQVEIRKVGNRGAKTPTEAMNRDSGGNVSLSTEAKKLTDISDGVSRLFVEYVEKNFTKGGTKGLWVQYVPDVTKDSDEDGYADVDNSSISVTVKTKGDALVADTPETLTPTAASTQTGYYFFEFDLNEQSETKDLVSVLQVTANNGKADDDDDKSTLYREITLRVMKKMDMQLQLVPNYVAGQGSTTVLKIALPDGLPESMFPLEIMIEDTNHSLYSTGSDGNGHTITVPVKTDKSLVDGTTNSFYFIRTVNKDEYDSNHTICTEFKTNKDASATTIYVANEYFKTQTINLLNDGMYVNPTNATVAFTTTSVDVQVEFANYATGNKSWTVTTEDSNITVAPASGTGNGQFRMSFPENTSNEEVTRTVKVVYNGAEHEVNIVQTPFEFAISPATQTLAFYETTTTVTVYAEEGQSWTASISGQNGTNPTLSDYSGTGTATLTVTIPANTGTQRAFTVSATMGEKTVNATIEQHQGPTSPASFAKSAFTVSSNSAQAVSADGYVTVNLNNVSRTGNDYNYFRMSNGNAYGTITVTPANGIKVTKVTITFDGVYYESDPTLTPDSSDYDVTSESSGGWFPTTTYYGIWTLSATSAATFTVSTNGSSAPRVSNIEVEYEAAN